MKLYLLILWTALCTGAALYVGMQMTPGSPTFVLWLLFVFMATAGGVVFILHDKEK